jgi:hypothetical protein
MSDAFLYGAVRTPFGQSNAGGVESVTRAPWALLKPNRPFPAGDRVSVMERAIVRVAKT